MSEPYTWPLYELKKNILLTISVAAKGATEDIEIDGKSRQMHAHYDPKSIVVIVVRNRIIQIKNSHETKKNHTHKVIYASNM